eukprot:CAMPEP_0115307664 /NCGR_PEP_ID=MMETSP0270-20121206/73266_1 /TAXON_ID=71861 /ORGANISM="Scrippsiella trochoidea, Strain CCMP3099" /LENGTH=119 /DNA_ID=CAMNT_0002726131 /DNA_START=119 /DNA_END=475 /DNA_ORIENTATION=-
MAEVNSSEVGDCQVEVDEAIHVTLAVHYDTNRPPICVEKPDVDDHILCIIMMVSLRSVPRTPEIALPPSTGLGVPACAIGMMPSRAGKPLLLVPPRAPGLPWPELTQALLPGLGRDTCC